MGDPLVMTMAVWVLISLSGGGASGPSTAASARRTRGATKAVRGRLGQWHRLTGCPRLTGTPPAQTATFACWRVRIFPISHVRRRRCAGPFGPMSGGGGRVPMVAAAATGRRELTLSAPPLVVARAAAQWGAHSQTRFEAGCSSQQRVCATPLAAPRPRLFGTRGSVRERQSAPPPCLYVMASGQPKSLAAGWRCGAPRPLR